MKSRRKTSSGQSLKNLSLSIGDFIRYWGFRRIHGAVWTQLYLSRVPLSCTDLTAKLGMSKALISPALDELCQYELIKEAAAPNQKTKVYQAVENISEVVQKVLRSRESKLLKQINQDFLSFKENSAKADDIDNQHVQSLEEMIVSANFMLEAMLSQEDLISFPNGSEA